MSRTLFCLVFAWLVVWGNQHSDSREVTSEPTDTISLSGRWAFRLDPEDKGQTEGWFRTALPDGIQLPGLLQAQGYGDPPGPESQWLAGIGLKRAKDPIFAPYWNRENFRSPFFLTPPRHYVGPAWYQREVVIPNDWQGCHITLLLERVHWRSTVWVDDQEVGSQDSLATPHVYDLSDFMTPGVHRLTIRVDNRYLIPVGTSAHSVSDETQGNWNGIVGRIELHRQPPVWIEDVQVYPELGDQAIEVEITLGNRTKSSGHGRLILGVEPHRVDSGPADSETGFRTMVTDVRWDEDGLRQKIRYRLGPSAVPWDEFRPALYKLTVGLETRDRGEGVFRDTRTVTFGLRHLEVRGTQFVLNGRPIFLRGTLECCIFPRTGHPPTDVESWRKILSVARSYGLNHIRFHSWCPPEAAFVAADEMGFYYQVECSCWTSFGKGDPQDAFVYSEAARIRRAYGNHPSFMFMVASNEPGGAAQQRDAFLSKWVEMQKAVDPRRCYSAGSGWPQLAANQYHVTPTPRLQAWGPLQLNKPGQTWLDYREFIMAAGVPVVSHEIGQWCAYPNVVSEPEKYTGFFRGSNVEVFREILQKKGMGAQAEDFVRASGRFQVLLYKHEIEAALRTPGMAGFQLLDLHDFPGQGTAPVGVLDAFWESKGYCSLEEYRRFCNSTVPLARLKKFVWTTAEELEFQLDLAHFGPTDLKNAVLSWELRTDKAVIARGRLPGRDYPTGRLTEGPVQSVKLTDVTAPAVLTLTVSLEGSDAQNEWRIWVYPADPAEEVPNSVVIVQDPWEAREKAEAGATVLLVPHQKLIAGNTLGTFQPIFWNRITFPSQKVHMVGILCDPQHPALKDFPTAFHADWQWQELLDACKPMILDELPPEIRPMVQAIDDWCEARKLGLVWEARLGKGKVLVCSMDILSDLSSRPAAKQLRASLLHYAASPAFDPPVALSARQWQVLWQQPRLLDKLGAVASADSFQPGFEPALAIDGDPNTMWHTAWEPQAAPPPHWLILDLRQPVPISGVKVLPRQDGNPNGQVGEFEIYVSTDAQSWGTSVAKGRWDPQPIERVVRFPQPVTARYVKFVALREVRGQPFTSIAEFDVIPVQNE